MGFFDLLKGKKASSKQTEAASTAPEEIELVAPATGTLLPIEEVSDAVFSKKLLGDGFAVLPTEDQVVAPVSGTVEGDFPTKHAFMVRVGRLEVLMHLGVNTVELQGEPFTSEVQVGDSVTAGTPMSRMDRQKVSDSGRSTEVIIVFTNFDEAVDSFVLTASGQVRAGEVIGRIVLKP